MAIYGRSIGSGSRILGGGGPGMYSITLPRSVYYADAAEWVQVSTQSPTGDYRRQVIVGNSLWVFDGSSAYEIDLDTGLTINTVTGCDLGGNIVANGSGYSTKAVSYPGNVVTDGTNIYWCNRASLMQLNTSTKAVTILGGVDATTRGKTLVYCAFNNCIYMIGGIQTTNVRVGSSTKYDKVQLQSKEVCHEYNISSNTITAMANMPVARSHAWAFSDDETGEIYFGSGYAYTTNSSMNHDQSGKYVYSVYRFNPSTNAYTLIKSDMPFSFSHEQSYIAIGNRMLSFNNQNVYSWNPKTGETYADQMPEPLTDAVLFNNVAVKDNSLYSSQGSGLWRCVFYEDLPANAPIVAKIYAGNKYHTTQPFTIHAATGDINVTTTQQTAEDDIEIKMYTYDNAGGQVLIIETGGD